MRGDVAIRLGLGQKTLGWLPRKAAAFALLILCACCLAAGIASAQRASESGVFTLTVANWSRTLNAAERYIDTARLDPERTAEFRQSIVEIRTSALSVSEEAAKALAALEPRLEALGPAPAEGDLAESEEIAAERERLGTQITDLRARQSLADVTLARIASLQAEFDALDRAVFVTEILREFPAPYKPAVIRDGVTQMVAGAQAIIATGPEWWRNLPADRKKVSTVVGFAVAIALAILLGWTIRQLLTARFGVSVVDDSPSYTRRLLAALIESVTRGIVPSAFLLVVLIRANTEGALISGPFAGVVSNLCIALIAFILAVEIPRSALSPENPTWRLTRLTPASASTLVPQLRVLALTFVLFAFYWETMKLVAPEYFTDPSRSVFGTIFALVLGFQILFLLKAGHWRFDPVEAEQTDEGTAVPEETGTPPSGRRKFWQTIRWLLILATLVAMVAPFMGYVLLSGYLIGNLLSTGLLFGVMYLVRGFLREVIGLFTSSAALRITLQWDHAFRSRMKFWLRAVVDVLLLPGLIFVVLPIWGLPGETLFRWIGAVLEGVEVGGVRLSPADTIIGIVVFFVILALVRTLKIALGTKVLPQTHIDPGLQNSLTTGLGYVGFIAAAMIAVIVMGVDLSGVAIVAGALSVGIGFGLQNVVNNFVSGLILLIERPIKVGDWVVVGAIEGTVKQINVRSTEIETFQRAAVIIPNADLIANSVTNWTHKDKYGRVEVPVGVAYGTDTRLVEKILLEVARAHPRIMRFPAPFVVFQDFGASSLDFELRAYTNDVLWRVIIASDIRYELERRFREEGVEVPFPQRVVHMVSDQQGPESPPADPS